jgi:NitT/TauT family transport system permease protein
MVGLDRRDRRRQKDNMHTNVKEKLLTLYTKTIAVVIFFAGWGIIAANDWVSGIILPDLKDVVGAFAKLIENGVLVDDILISLERTGLGFLLAIGIAIPLGILMGWSARFEKYIDPLLQIFRNTSVLAMFPIFILIFGLDEISKIAIICWGSLWPCLLNTIDGVKGADPDLIRISRSMGITTFGLLWKIIIPAALPGILTGVRVSAGIAVIVMVAAEMLGSNRGLGFLVFNSQQRFQPAHMYVGIITIAALGVLINFALIKLEHRVIGWHKEASGNPQGSE